MKLRCVVIEDEPPAQQKLVDFIERVPFLNLVYMFSSAIDAQAHVKSDHVDLLFLDIHLGLLNAMDFLALLSNPPKIIITTAYADYALKGYELSVNDYLLKPYSFERFYQAVTKVYQNFEVSSTQENAYLFVKSEHRLEKINTSDILYVEGMKDYLKIATIDRNIMTLLSFKKLQEKLPTYKFIRVHNSFIVSVEKIELIERDRIQVGNRLIPISQSHRKSFYQSIKKYFP